MKDFERPSEQQGPRRSAAVCAAAARYRREHVPRRSVQRHDTLHGRNAR